MPRATVYTLFVAQKKSNTDVQRVGWLVVCSFGRRPTVPTERKVQVRDALAALIARHATKLHSAVLLEVMKFVFLVLDKSELSFYNKS